eukprot:gene7243-4542_t
MPAGGALTDAEWARLADLSRDAEWNYDALERLIEEGPGTEAQ